MSAVLSDLSIVDAQALRLKRAHIALMRQPSTALYSGVMLMGKNEVKDGEFTAYTNGVDKIYSARFLARLSDPEVRALVLHENLHVALNQIPRGMKMFNENPTLTKMAADYVVNDIIVNVKVKLQGTDEPLLKLPENGLYDPMFHNWSMREVFEYLKKECEKPTDDGDDETRGGEGDEKGNEPSDGGQSPTQGGDSGKRSKPKKMNVNGKDVDPDGFDEHDVQDVKEMTPEETKELGEKIEQALRQGGLLAGRLGGKVPRAITESLEPKVDWREVLRDFVASHATGKDEMTWRKYNRRLIANDMYLPSVINETIGEVIFAVDTSGSIDQEQLNEAASELASVCELCEPELVRVLWWDTSVKSEQKITPDRYGQLRHLLKPAGGGGTHVSSVAQYIKENRINAEAVIVVTDGYVEGDIDWCISTPTLWLVTRNRSFTQPAGTRMVRMEKN